MQNRVFMIVWLFILGSQQCFAQTKEWSRAFPVTDYIMALSDSVKVVQVHLPGGPVLKEKQIGLLQPIYRAEDLNRDTIISGYGRCRLIKGDYYYFDIKVKPIGKQIRKDDLIYTSVSIPTSLYDDRLLKIASHAIVLQNVYEDPLYNTQSMFEKWEKETERVVLDSMVSDVRFTGNYFLSNDPSMDKLITTGRYANKKVFAVMIACQPADIKDFLDYMIARPRLYAGHSWKIAEVFATWVSEGAPTVIKQ